MTREYQNWHERIAASNEVMAVRVRYTRKSTESSERQVASHNQQTEAADKLWGEIDARWWWQDSCTGTTFERPAFEDLLNYCRANRHPASSPGRVEMYDPSRFGRILDAAGKPDIMTFFSVYSDFERCGWHLHFVTVPRSDDSLVNVITMALYAYAAAIYSANLSANVRRGRESHSSEGWWTAGRAPWGTIRKDTHTGRILGANEASTAGGGGVILVPDEPVLRHWLSAANRIMGGASLDMIGADFYAHGYRGPRGGNLGHSSIRNFLTNPALVGRVEYLATPKDGKRTRVMVPAKWEPMVDVALFEKVVRQVGPRPRTAERRQRKRRDLFPLRVACAQCGLDYTGGRLSAAQGGSRQYAHVRPKERMREDDFRQYCAAGCKTWYVDSWELESKIKDLIVAERMTDAFESEIRDLILARDEFRKAADSAVEEARRALDTLIARDKNLAQLVATVADQKTFKNDPLVAQLCAGRQLMITAKEELHEAECFAQSRNNAWEELSRIIHETRNLARAWDKCGPEERKILLDYWVHDVLIVVEPVPGMKRANQKTAVVTLRTAPNAPKHFMLGAQPPSEHMAERKASRTATSNSRAARVSSESSADGSPMRSNAQAACSRTSGSSSSNALTSVDTASREPRLPSATATLRKKPRRLERLIGEPLENSRHPSGDIPISSTGEGEILSECGASAASESSRENLWLYGQTS